MIEALYYQKEKNNRLLCALCPRRCSIAEGHLGFCGVRQNIEGSLFALSYGKVASLALDPIEKKPLYHFFPATKTLSTGTFGCNMRCLHCQNSTLSQAEILKNGSRLTECSPQRLVEYAIQENCPTLVWTYNEPLVGIEYILESGKLAKQKGLKTAVVTAGGINTEPLKQVLSVIDAYRLDIKGFTKELYSKLTGFDFLETVLNSALLAKEAGKHIEIVTNIIPNWNDDEEQLTGIAKWINQQLGPETAWHVTAYYPAYKMQEPPTPVATLDKAIDIGKKIGLKHIYAGNVTGHPAQHTICPNCEEKLIIRTGYQTKLLAIKDGCCAQCGHKLQAYQG